MIGPKERPQFIAPVIGAAAGGGPIGLAVFGVIAVASLLGGLFGLFGGDSVASADLQKLRDDTNKAIDTTYRFSWKSLFAFGGLLRALDAMWNSVIKPLAQAITKLATQLASLVGKVIGPILQALHRVRQILNQIYDKFLRPVLNHIQQVRRVLQILRLFHVPFADKLDGILARIQGKIIGPFLWVLRTMNGYGRWLNLIITAKGTIQRPLFLNSAYRDQAALVSMFWNSQTSTARGGSPGSAHVAVAPPDASQVSRDFSDLARNDGGRFAAPAGVSELTFRSIVGV